MYNMIFIIIIRLFSVYKVLNYKVCSCEKSLLTICTLFLNVFNLFFFYIKLKTIYLFLLYLEQYIMGDNPLTEQEKQIFSSEGGQNCKVLKVHKDIAGKLVDPRDPIYHKIKIKYSLFLLHANSSRYKHLQFDFLNYKALSV